MVALAVLLGILAGGSPASAKSPAKLPIMINNEIPDVSPRVVYLVDSGRQGDLKDSDLRNWSGVAG